MTDSALHALAREIAAMEADLAAKKRVASQDSAAAASASDKSRRSAYAVSLVEDRIAATRKAYDALAERDHLKQGVAAGLVREYREKVPA